VIHIDLHKSIMNDTQPYCKMGFRAHFVLEWVVRSVLSCIGQDCKLTDSHFTYIILKHFYVYN
jgi:hypothetical protein